MIQVKSNLKKSLPRKYRYWLLKTRARLYRNARSLLYIGERYFCPICNGRFRMFLPFGVKPRQNAECPGCGSLERHRLLWFYLKDKTDFFTDNLAVLHFSPSYGLWDRFRKMDNLNYIAADISSPLAGILMDLMNASSTESQFDYILCIHVLEHIADDGKALQELFRILKPGGTAILQVPIELNRDKTFEDRKITSPEERELCYGQKDHLRVYGKDFPNRLQRTGFTVRAITYARELGIEKITRHGLIENEILFLSSKPEPRSAR